MAADYLPVRSHRPLRYLAGRRPCGGHITEGLAQTLLPRPIRNYRRVQILFRGIRPAGRRPVPDTLPPSHISLSVRQRLKPEVSTRTWGSFCGKLVAHS